MFFKVGNYFGTQVYCKWCKYFGTKGVIIFYILCKTNVVDHNVYRAAKVVKFCVAILPKTSIDMELVGHRRLHRDSLTLLATQPYVLCD